MVVGAAVVRRMTPTKNHRHFGDTIQDMRRIHTLVLALGLCLLAATNANAQAKSRSFSELTRTIDGGPEYSSVDKSEAIYQLAKFSDVPGTQKLVELLQGPLAPAAASALSNLRVAGSEAILIKALKSSNAKAKGLLCFLLGQRHTKTARTVLAEIVRHERSTSVLRAAVYALRWDVQRRPTGLAVSALLDATKRRSVAAKDVLMSIHNMRAAPFFREGLVSRSSTVREISREWLEAHRTIENATALAALSSTTRRPNVRQKAMHAYHSLGKKTGAQEAASILTKGLDDPDSSRVLRSLAALDRSLKSNGTPLPPSVNTLVSRRMHALFAHSDPAVVSSALLIAAHLGHASSTSKALSLTFSADCSIRAAAVTAVARTMTKPREGKALLRAIEKNSGAGSGCTPGRSRESKSMGTHYDLGKPRKGVARLVLDGLASPVKAVRLSTAESLIRQRDPVAALALIQAIGKEADPTVAKKMGRALHQCATPVVLRSMIPLLSTGLATAEVARAFVHADRAQNFTESLPILSQGGKAALALLRASSRDTALYKHALLSEEAKVRIMASHMLGRMGSLLGIGVLCKLLEDSSQMRRAAQSLSQTHHPGAARCLVRALRNGRNVEVVKALKQLTGEYSNDPATWRQWLKDNMGLGQGLPGLADALQSGQAARVAMASKAAERLSTQEVRLLLPALVTAYKDNTSTKARVAIICAMGVAKEPSLAVLLHESLDDKHSGIDERIARSKVLLSLGDDLGRRKLFSKLAHLNERSSKDTALRERIEEAIAQMQSQR